MRLIALVLARNEEWALGMTLRAVLRWCDGVVVLDHASTDRTPEIIQEVFGEDPERVRCLRNADPVWHEMGYRAQMHEAARAWGATHIGLVDADEILSANAVPLIRKQIECAPDGVTLETPWLALRGDVHHVFATGWWARSNVSTAFRDSPELHWSSAERGGYDFHHRHPLGRPQQPWQVFPSRAAGLMHLQFVNDRRLRAKQAFYQVTERLRWPNRDSAEVVRERYSFTVREAANGVVAPVPEQWWAGYEDLLQHFHPDTEPWQEAELRRAIHENPGVETGLDMFGIIPA